jgi:ribosomal protein L15
MEYMLQESKRGYRLRKKGISQRPARALGERSGEGKQGMNENKVVMIYMH